ncbi:MAG TPA: cytochrome c3 family protein, partial [Stellaceae bacterium]|nr:cytochrome c3 family protein [Stellaceae bacterium]
MEVEITFLSRRGTAVMRRSQRVSALRVGLGRGTDNEVPLADIRVGLHVAALVPRDGGLAIERLDSSPLEVNGRLVDTASLKQGDEIRIGPYRLEVLEPPEGCDGAVQIELVQAAAAAGDHGPAAHIGLEHTGASKRRYAWTGFLVVAVVCLAVPIIVFSSGAMRPWQKGAKNPVAPQVIGLSWNAGDFSNAHRFFAADCKSCHEGGFTRVADKACLACHGDIGSHVPHGVQLGSVGKKLSEERCIACHTEHRGIAGSVVSSSGLCLDCHRDLKEAVPAAGVNDVHGFPKGHPQFRVTLVADAAKGTTQRVELGSTPPPMDHPGLKFSHAAHLVKGGFPALHYKEMVCADCHVADPSGRTFLPITYKNQCESCHALTFDKVTLPWPDAKVPHGDDTGVIATVWNYYAGVALQGGRPAPGAPASPPVERRGAGMPPPAA